MTAGRLRRKHWAWGIPAAFVVLVVVLIGVLPTEADRSVWFVVGAVFPVLFAAAIAIGTTTPRSPLRRFLDGLTVTAMFGPLPFFLGASVVGFWALWWGSMGWLLVFLILVAFTTPWKEGGYGGWAPW